MAELLVLLMVVALILGGVALYRRHAIQQRHATEQAALETQLSTSKRAADEDVTKFGEELQRLDSDVAGHALDEGCSRTTSVPWTLTTTRRCRWMP
jgi:tRNA A37 N6-isopentenylltransferase MiaA